MGHVFDCEIGEIWRCGCSSKQYSRVFGIYLYVLFQPKRLQCAPRVETAIREIGVLVACKVLQLVGFIGSVVIVSALYTSHIHDPFGIG